MKCSLGISNFLEEISSLSHSIVFLYLITMVFFEQICQVSLPPKKNVFAMVIVVMIAVAVFCGNFDIVNIVYKRQFPKFSFHNIVPIKEICVYIKKMSILKINSI